MPIKDLLTLIGLHEETWLGMFPIIGIVVVFACIAGGYLIEKGSLVLMQ